MENLIGAIVFLIIGGVFFFAGFYLRKSSYRIQTTGIKTKAKIVDFVEEKITDADGYSNTYHFPIVRFTDRIGIETSQKLDSSENPKRINELLDIIYLKNGDEYEVMINNKFCKSYFYLIFIIGGLLFNGIGIVWLISKI